MSNEEGDEEGDEEEFLRGVLQRIATGPTMSKDLSREEARRAMRLLLEGRADEVQGGIFLIALRMKRETDEELAGVLDAIHDGVSACELDIDELLTVVDPYDGYLRGTPVAPFLPAVLAACGAATAWPHSRGSGSCHHRACGVAAIVYRSWSPSAAEPNEGRLLSPGSAT